MKREQGLPLAYALERAEFYGLTFEVGPEVLIPRSETEFLVAQGDKWIKENRFKYKGLENGIQLLDLGCGSGCVGIALAHLHPTVKATLTDVSAPALEYAHENAKRHQVLERCDFRTGDWFSVLKRRERFHIILCNPPYVTDRDDPALAQAVKEHEPSLALFLDEDPQEFYFRLARKAVSHLYSGGMFAVEVGYDTAWPARCALNKVNALTRGREVHDFIGLERVIWGIRR